MNIQRKFLLRLVAVAIGLLATITWVGEAEASTPPYLTATSTATTGTETTTTTTILPGNPFTTNSIGWGGGS